MSETASFIPKIDIAGLYSSDPAVKAAVADRIGQACDDSGFFYVVNHHVPVETIEGARDAAAAFFQRPMEEKLRVHAGTDNRGYREVTDSVHRNGKTNAKDSFDLGFLDIKADDPEVLAGTPLYAPNRWPADMPDFRAALEAYYQGTFEVGMKVLEGFAIYLGRPEDFFTRHFTRPIADMVINHYWGAKGLHISDQASGPHTDHGIVTILWQDMTGGLEVMGHDGAWLPAPPVRGSYVINVGELLKRWTNGRFKATVHRVVHLADAPRFSMPLFCNPNYDTLVDPRALGASEAEAKYPPILSGDFLCSRFSATRKSWGAEIKPASAPAGVEVVEMAAN
jgi:isopenicillin N synthase-like dioxygenase